MTVWLTGLPCSGKTTLGGAVVDRLRAAGCKAELLDGDVLRRELWNDLDFSRRAREENIRRLAFLARMLSRNGVIAVVSAVSPYRAIRDEVRRGLASFIEVYVNAPQSVCEQRDVKGMYRRARMGELKQFTGIDDCYEPPHQPDVECRTDIETVEQSAEKVLRAVNGTTSLAMGGRL